MTIDRCQRCDEAAARYEHRTRGYYCQRHYLQVIHELELMLSR